ncbi:YgdI/YgdR family lipoprotein [Salmonella enterica]|nr:YgdI/YgdR family lipoprotein [Salmonella enterica]
MIFTKIIRGFIRGKPEVDTATGMTKYADVYGYHRVIKTSEIVQTTEGASKLDW